MTLLLACATESHSIHVSDRRLTWLSGPKAGSVADDPANKAVVVEGTLAFSYTGLATMGRESTDDWLLDVLANGMTENLRDLLENLARRAGDAIRQLRQPAHLCRHAFLVGGWSTFKGVRGVRPFLGVVSNALDSSWTWQSTARGRFDFDLRQLASGAPFLACSLGQPTGRPVQVRLLRELRKIAARGLGPGAYIDALAVAIRSVARQNDWVGADLMSISLPRSPSDPGAGFALSISGDIPADQPVALYMAESGDRRIVYGPHIISGGMRFRGFSASSERTEGWPEP